MNIDNQNLLSYLEHERNNCLAHLEDIKKKTSIFSNHNEEKSYVNGRIHMIDNIINTFKLSPQYHR